MPRSSSKKAGIFNPRASNDWSKDESKFGQRMLEKMGWKKGQGIGRNNQGITDNIKVRLKLDSKGLGYKIKEDHWLEVRNEFSELLSELSQSDAHDEHFDCKTEKKSLEAVSQSSKARVHYRKFTRGKDIAKYRKEDLIGIFGQEKHQENVDNLNKEEFIPKGNMEEYFKSKKRRKHGTEDSSLENESEVPEVNIAKCKKEDHIGIFGQEKQQEDVDNLNKEEFIEKGNMEEHFMSKKRRKRGMEVSSLVNESDIPEVTPLLDNCDNKCNSVKKSSKKSGKKDSSLVNESEVPEVNIAKCKKEDLIGIFGQEKQQEDVDNINKEEFIEKGNMEEYFTSKKRKKRGMVDSSLVNESDIPEVTPLLDNCDNKCNSVKKSSKKSGKKDSSLVNESDVPKVNIAKCKKEDLIGIFGQEKHQENIDDLNKEEFIPKGNMEEYFKSKKRRKHGTEDSSLQNESEVSEVNIAKCKKEDHIGIFGQEKQQENVDNLNKEEFIQKGNMEEHLMSKKRRKRSMEDSSLVNESGIPEVTPLLDNCDSQCSSVKKSAVIHLQKRNASKAEKIVAKARLLKSIRDDKVTHDFKGCNLTNIRGYGSVIC